MPLFVLCGEGERNKFSKHLALTLRRRLQLVTLCVGVALRLECSQSLSRAPGVQSECVLFKCATRNSDNGDFRCEEERAAYLVLS